MLGSVTRQNVCNPLAPSTRAASSSSVPLASMTGMISRATNGNETKIVASTMPNIKWGLLYGVILCNARAMGEFGAVSVVSGKIRGMTNTLPLHVEILYNEYAFQAAFAVSSLLASLALVTLVLKTLVERRVQRAPADAAGQELEEWPSTSAT